MVVGASFFVGAGTLYALGAKTFLSATVSQLTIAGFTSGFVGGFIASGGNLKEAALSAVTAAAFAGVGRALALVTAAPSVEVAAHAVIGGTSSELRGGKFATGAISSGVAEGLTPIAASLGGQTQLGQTIAIAVVGGVTSELGGGKFTNGAATAAFAYVFNASANKRPGIGHNNPPEPISGNLLVRALAGIGRAIIGAGAFLWAYQPGTVADARRLPAFEILETDGSAVHMYVDTHAGQLEVMTAQSMQGSTLLLEGFHIEGPGAGSISSTMELRSNLRAYGRLNNAEEVVLKGAVRTTGANPGRIPRTLRIRVNE